MQLKDISKQKIKSESGASLAAALLFFIVCAVVGSIILAAALSSAGRMKGITSADNQRYALTAARELIESRIVTAEDDTNTEHAEYTVTAAIEDTVQSINTDAGSLTVMATTMANHLYVLYWDEKEVQNSWPQTDSQSAGTAESSNGNGNRKGTKSSTADRDAVSQRVGETDTEMTSAWVPSQDIDEANWPSCKSVMSLEYAAGAREKECPEVTAEFVMHPDFSIYVTLTEENGLTDQFIIHPDIQVSYESVAANAFSNGNSAGDEASGTGSGSGAANSGSGAASAASNRRQITFTVRWDSISDNPTNSVSD